jgi:transcriptional regulator with XRE-family HTH domain
MPTSPHQPPADELVPPAESSLLRAAYKKSGLTVADLASATGLSVGTVNIALSGIRYRDGKAKIAIPADRTLVKLASVLRIHPEILRAHDRRRAAELLAEASEASSVTPIASDLDAQAVAAGRSALARQVLALFAAEELRAELERRDRAEHDALDREAWDDVAETLRSDQWPV